MNRHTPIRKLLLGGFVVFSLACTCFIKFQNIQSTFALNHALEQQQNLKNLIHTKLELSEKINIEIKQRQEAEQRGFFKKLYPPEFKEIIRKLALGSGIDIVFIKFGNLKHNDQSVCSVSVKLTLQSELDTDVFQLIDALRQQNFGLIDIVELNMFRHDNNAFDGLSLKTELLIHITNFDGQQK